MKDKAYDCATVAVALAAALALGLAFTFASAWLFDGVTP